MSKKILDRFLSVAAASVAIAAVVSTPGLAAADFQILDLQVPEPETLALLGVGALAMLVTRWGRRK
jgi:hypothetical protein